MDAKEKFKVKNANRKAAKERVGSKAYNEARWRRKIGFVGKDGECLNGAFGNVRPLAYNELVIGTSGVQKDYDNSDLENEQEKDSDVND